MHNVHRVIISQFRHLKHFKADRAFERHAQRVQMLQSFCTRYPIISKVRVRQGHRRKGETDDTTVSHNCL